VGHRATTRSPTLPSVRDDECLLESASHALAASKRLARAMHAGRLVDPASCMARDRRGPRTRTSDADLGCGLWP
jgi:hypothetical protein